MKDKLIGTWRLVFWENRRTSGKVYYPMGEDAIGQIMYSEDGYMSVALMTANRKPFKSEAVFGGTKEEKATIADTFIAYCGKYAVKENRVIHHIEMCSFPNWVGIDQERLFELSENRLSLTTPLIFISDEERETAHLIWERV